ncbi:hypothetical protein TrST_g10430 [Triparma strigata]|uniref:DUF218 domain-containing protein n=1 Tax=Triparma strigata TaxID=1606541 RepID=A0A9W7C9V6_9STRA|nr:hypothetical protein TrST_g10430 [Triparma strigata]
MAAKTCIVVLGFAHRYSEASKNRLQCGLEQFCDGNDGNDKFIVFTGGNTTGCGETEAEYLIRKAKKSLPASSYCKLLKEDEAKYTIENAIFVRRIVESLSGVEKLIVVTNEFHLRRSLLIFSTVFEVLTECTVTGEAAPDGENLERDTGISQEVWLEQEEKQLALLRSENGSNVGNLLSQRIKAHGNIALAAKHENMGALRSWRELNGGDGADIDGQSMRGGAGALHYAVLYGMEEAVKWLVEAGADVNKRNDWGATPLHFLSTVQGEEKRKRIALLLAKGGPNSSIKGRSALWGGEEKEAGEVKGRGLGYQKLALLGSLLAFGDVIYSQLIEAAREGDLDTVRGWIKDNPEMSVDGPEGYAGTTALAHAASGGSAEVVTLLLERGADVRLPKSPKSNSFHYAAFKMHRNCFRILKTAKGSEEALQSRGESELWGSLGCVSVKELALFVAKEAEEFAKNI